jgi:hypothetical protein
MSEIAPILTNFFLGFIAITTFYISITAFDILAELKKNDEEEE